MTKHKPLTPHTIAHEESTTVTEEFDGQRLDSALSLLTPTIGIRGRRRLWDYGEILVNGKKKPSGFRVASGDTITICTYKENSNIEEYSPQKDDTPTLAIVTQNNILGLCAISKPSGIHSAAIAGSPP